MPQTSDPITLPHLSGVREAELLEAVNMLLAARRSMEPITDKAGLPPALAPTSVAEVYFIQDRLVESFGEVGGWKVGAPTPEATPYFAPMPNAWLAMGGSILRGRTHRYRGLEAEVAFRLGQDLPPRATLYTREEIIESIDACSPAIEILESAYADPTAVPPMCMLADLQMHGGFIYGPPCPEWRTIDFTKETVVMAVDGIIRVERVGSNTSGDLFRLLPYLANQASVRTGGLRAGQWITTGSWTGNTLASAGSAVDVRFSTLGRVSMHFE